MKNSYPPHLSEPNRIAVANSYIQKELRMLLPHFITFNEIDMDIDSWFERLGTRDYWNGIHGVAMGFKLKHHFIHVLTAENIEWQKKEILLDNNLMTGISLDFILPHYHNRATASDIKDLFIKNKQAFLLWEKNHIRNINKNNSERSFPIIAVQEYVNEKPILSIHDGNNRMIQSAIYDMKTISAFVGTYKSAEFVPHNFWIPTSVLMDIVYNGRLSENYSATATYLKSIIKMSESGKYELKNRVLIGKNEFRKRLKKELFPEKNL